MIVLDIESSGLDAGRCGIWQIGALELENPHNSFLEEGRIDDEDTIEAGALKLTGKIESDLRDQNKQSQKDLILNFLNWTNSCKIRIPIGHNVGWDLSFIQNKCIRYGLTDKFRDSISIRSLDTHTIAQIRYKQKNGSFLINERNKSDMNLSNVMALCNIEDDRMRIEGSKVIKEGKAHNALEDVKLTAKCFNILIK